jgi:hypothetical protein
LVSRIFQQAGASTVHRSATYAEDYPSLRLTAVFECDAIVVVFRDPYSTMSSQRWSGRAYEKLMEGYQEIFYSLTDINKPMWVLTYEQLVLNPASINPLLKAWGLDPSLVTEEITNQNTKHALHQ